MRYQLRTDTNAHAKNLPVKSVDCDYFGQLLHLIVLPLQPSAELGIQESETLILAAIRTIKATLLQGSLCL
ncbi:hypothetical protein AcW1_003669 [Taiwanofungus camphoratus]|nr:hypothetical protein AcW1_003669 [Antrodia cinnamomea]